MLAAKANNMIPLRIRALFDFIDFLDSNKAEYIKTYIPLCNELVQLDIHEVFHHHDVLM